MKKVLLAMLIFSIVGIASVQAQTFWVGSVYNDNSGTFVPNIMGFDWASSGSGNVGGLGPPGTPLVPGTNFTFRYQSYLFSLTDPSGNTVPFPGLNSNFEYTVVAQLPEVVTASTDLGGGLFQGLFSTLPGGVFYMYHDAPRNADVATGFGFDDGTLVAAGTIDAGLISVFTFNTNNWTGIGSTILAGSLTYVNPAYLDPATSVINFRFEGLLNSPSLDSTTASFFNGRSGEGNLATYTVGSNDLPFKVDGSSKFITTPCIDIEKEISIDGGQTWYDADTEATAPHVTAPHGALYRLIVTNCGYVVLTNVLINDPTLLITNYSVGNLAAGSKVTLTSAEITQLNVATRCNFEGSFDNTAYVSGQDPIGTVLTDNDPAWLVCTQCSGNIGDFVWQDLNRNGIQDVGEPGINGVTVRLRNISGTVIATTSTATHDTQKGYYQFSGLCAGTYTVEVVTPAGFTPTTPCSTNQTIPNDSNCSPAAVNLATNNSSNQTIDFGYTSRPPVVVPTMTEWGMIIFMVLAGLGSLYFIWRQRKV